ncbi:DUF1989 domain-containing protein [Conexibacter sp. JD483]|uniref:DUF1989 domain-containing protein n=1 Tax=unclassified Conexibacter TaxID=2627773 RepID=UPI00271810A2|nr:MULTISPECIES: DUF1989 domain-containing protein [unclassified Conexibacter]MDO8187662.1 DUF1989 domain-containing protein [Conexibacter sp. CPCC 205706]MDO8199847.1 DUF1989 domain-containing protein [Conexibacter sp. CPCC 205762]MDR9370224.1 DUF1989 domain-containing protein [Conexibacter sp. JD483]
MPEVKLAAGTMAVAALSPGDTLSVRALVAGQVAELVAHAAADPRERLSTLLTGLAEGAYTLREGMTLWSQEYSPLLRVEELSNEQHDLALEACTPWIARALGNEPVGTCCWSSFRAWLEQEGLPEKWVPYPVGIFKQAEERDGRYGLAPGSSAAGDFVRFSAASPCTVLVSACALTTGGEPGVPAIEVTWND